ncbi:MAG: hypothetical protein DRO16_01670 [Thermoprotei archaeon]|nr:MAG: hypothetical protein DRO16_01670 [Thermoprotei archaeon]
MGGFLRVCIIYDSKHETGATSSIARCIATTIRNTGIEVTVCKPSQSCPDPHDFDLVIIGTPIYYERPMKSIIEFIEKNSGLHNCRVAVFLTCFIASKKVPKFIRNIILKKYLDSVMKHIKGNILSFRAFKGWLWKPDEDVIRECIEWCKELSKLIKVNIYEGD